METASRSNLPMREVCGVLAWLDFGDLIRNLAPLQTCQSGYDRASVALHTPHPLAHYEQPLSRKS